MVGGRKEGGCLRKRCEHCSSRLGLGEIKDGSDRSLGLCSVQCAVSLQFVICRGKGSGREGLDKRLGRRFIGFAYSGRN
jgi:hypothetical protein